MNLRDMTDAIATALSDHGEDYDLDALIDDLHTRYGIVPIDDIPTDEFWEIAARHHLPEGDDTDSAADRFDDEVTAAITTDRPAGVPAVWQRGGITVEITGANRANPSRRLHGATITITSTTGATAAPRGLTTTADLWPHVQTLLTGWEQAVREQQEAVQQALHAADRTRDAAEKAVRC